MSGQRVNLRVDKSNQKPGIPRFCQSRFTYWKMKQGREKVRGLTLKSVPARILGNCRVDGNGQSELAEAVCTCRESRDGPCVSERHGFTRLSVARHRRWYFIRSGGPPPCRLGHEMSVADNAILVCRESTPQFVSKLCLRLGNPRSRSVTRFGISSSGSDLAR